MPTPDVGVCIVTVGAESDVYPSPLSDIEMLPIPAELVTRTEVAAAPTPNVVEPIPAIVDKKLLIVIVGATVYP